MYKHYEVLGAVFVIFSNKGKVGPNYPHSGCALLFIARLHMIWIVFSNFSSTLAFIKKDRLFFFKKKRKRMVDLNNEF
jgi:hypothetical protein